MVSNQSKYINFITCEGIPAILKKTLKNFQFANQNKMYYRSLIGIVGHSIES